MPLKSKRSSRQACHGKWTKSEDAEHDGDDRDEAAQAGQSAAPPPTATVKTPVTPKASAPPVPHTPPNVPEPATAMPAAEQTRSGEKPPLAEPAAAGSQTSALGRAGFWFSVSPLLKSAGKLLLLVRFGKGKKRKEKGTGSSTL